jgi:hypothetical protein
MLSCQLTSCGLIDKQDVPILGVVEIVLEEIIGLAEIYPLDSHQL